MTTYYKCTATNGSACHGGSGSWPLPHDGQPGEWIEAPGPLVLCVAGTLHVCRREDVVLWLSAELHEVEVEGPVLEGADKVGCLRARITRTVSGWTERTARLFAVDCAARALQREREAGREPDPRSWAAVEVAGRYASGEASAGELAAARAAARDAAMGAARAAARDAAMGAARDAAWAAAREAAMGAAWDAERAWQTERLFALLGEGGEP